MSDFAVISLFAGVGGFDLAARNLGIPTIAAVEIDDYARGVIAHQFPETRTFIDVTKVSGKELLNGYTGRIILTGGFPCQDLSVAGKRTGLVGARSGLFWEIVRIAEEIQPEILLLENVPGLLSSNGGRDMGTVIGALGNIGYRCGWRVLDAQHFGVPQRRRRVFIVAARNLGTNTIAEILFESQSGGRDSEAGNETGQDFAGTVTAGIGNSGIIGSDVVGAWCASDYKFPQQQQVMENKLIVQQERERECLVKPDSEPTQPESKLSTPAWSNDQRTQWSSVNDIANCISAELYHKQTVVNQDANNAHLVYKVTPSANQ